MTRLIIFTFISLIISLLLFESTNLDIVIQNNFFNFGTNQWILDKNSTLPKFVFYDGIKKLYIAFVITVLITLIFLRKLPSVERNKRGLLIVLISCIVIPLFIGLLKATTNVPCPKDIQYYGGKYPYVTVFSHYPETFQQQKKIKCYPAGHASGGFALMSLFFLFANKRKKYLALIISIMTGWAIGNYKMLIGDHFFSHTFITMIISWLLILFINIFVNKYFHQESRLKIHHDI